MKPRINLRDEYRAQTDLRLISDMMTFESIVNSADDLVLITAIHAFWSGS